MINFCKPYKIQIWFADIGSKFIALSYLPKKSSQLISWFLREYLRLTFIVLPRGSLWHLEKSWKICLKIWKYLFHRNMVYTSWGRGCTLLYGNCCIELLRWSIKACIFLQRAFKPYTLELQLHCCIELLLAWISNHAVKYRPKQCMDSDQNPNKSIQYTDQKFPFHKVVMCA